MWGRWLGSSFAMQRFQPMAFCRRRQDLRLADLIANSAVITSCGSLAHAVGMTLDIWRLGTKHVWAFLQQVLLKILKRFKEYTQWGTRIQSFYDKENKLFCPNMKGIFVLAWNNKIHCSASSDPHRDILFDISWYSVWHIGIWTSCDNSFWHIFWRSVWQLRRGSAHCDQELARRRRRSGGGGRSGDALLENLTALTWQVRN